MRIFSYLVILIIVLFGVSFSVLNAQPVALNYYLGVKELSLSLLLVSSLGLGGFVGIIVALGPLLRLKKENFLLKRRIKQTQQEVENLRSIPIRDSH